MNSNRMIFAPFSDVLIIILLLTQIAITFESSVGLLDLQEGLFAVKFLGNKLALPKSYHRFL
jgi:hypothetical protein